MRPTFALLYRQGVIEIGCIAKVKHHLVKVGLGNFHDFKEKRSYSHEPELTQ